MNRDIKFRGIREQDNKMIYGNLVVLKNGEKVIVPQSDIERDGHHVMLDMDDYPTWFSEDTIGQYTGLKDKNGIEIYEGDIILAGYYKWRCKVVWDEKCARFIGLTNDKDVRIVYVDMVDKNDKSAVEVIGNIYENPDLLNSQN